jgi:DNA-binding response OmpR family regulator
MISQKLRVLMADDEEEIRRGAGLWLSAAGYEPSFACDGNEAVAEARRTNPDAIVLDVRMPHKNGLDALAELQKRDETKHIPVVMLSASLVDQSKALDAGATFFLTKPYAGKKLIAAVNAALNGPHVSFG